VVIWSDIIRDKLEPLLDHQCEVVIYPNASPWHADGSENKAQWSVCIRVQVGEKHLTLTKDYAFDLIVQHPHAIHAECVRLVTQAHGWFSERLPKRIA
jgi:hypothetical protein